MFPIRTTSHQWSIPLYTHHTCTERCRYGIDTFENHLFVLYYPDEDCPNQNKLMHTPINLSEYDIKTPRGIFGELYDPNRIVIYDTTFTIHINYPLESACNLHIETTKPTTLRELLQLIRDAYQSIYKVEEETAPSTRFVLQLPCTDCLHDNVHAHLTSIQKADGMCSICYTDYTLEDSISQCQCQHDFHTLCISKWIESSHRDEKRCPLCRARINHCAKCNDTLRLDYSLECIVLPMKYRINGKRNKTHGVYGLYDVDFEGLELTQIIYRKTNKTVYLIMSKW